MWLKLFEKGSNFDKNRSDKKKVIKLTLWILIFLQIDVIEEVFGLDPWNLFTKNIKY